MPKGASCQVWRVRRHNRWCVLRIPYRIGDNTKRAIRSSNPFSPPSKPHQTLSPTTAGRREEAVPGRERRGRRGCRVRRPGGVAPGSPPPSSGRPARDLPPQGSPPQGASPTGVREPTASVEGVAGPTAAASGAIALNEAALDAGGLGPQAARAAPVLYDAARMPVAAVALMAFAEVPQVAGSERAAESAREALLRRNRRGRLRAAASRPRTSLPPMSARAVARQALGAERVRTSLRRAMAAWAGRRGPQAVVHWAHLAVASRQRRGGGVPAAAQLAGSRPGPSRQARSAAAAAGAWPAAEPERRVPVARAPCRAHTPPLPRSASQACQPG